MFCPNCGKELAEDSKFCDSCGMNLAPQEQEQTPPAVPVKKEKSKAEKKADWKTAKAKYKEAKKAKRASEAKNKKTVRICLKLALALLIIVLAGLAVFFALFGEGKKEDPKKESAEAVTAEDKKTEDKKTEDQKTEEAGGSIGIDNPPDWDMPEKFEPERIDADEYFAENSQIVKEAKANEACTSEKDTYKNLTERGFTLTAITTKYSDKGEYEDEKEISEDGTDKHPVYSTYYMSKDGDIFVVYEIGGVVLASPLSYNLSGKSEVEVIISESETVTSYDGTLNKFYETIPNEDVMKVLVVDEINAETLSKLTEGEIESYEYAVEQN